jgi:ferredoxin-NADP reductase
MTTDVAFATTRRQGTAILQIGQRRTVADEVLLLTLVDPNGRELPEWAPGAHIELVLPGLGPRQYSLCGDPDDPSRWQIAVLRNPNGRGGSQYIHERLCPGTMLEVRRPRNHFPLVPSPRYLFIAGGVGITPIRPMLAAATAAGRSWELFYAGRSRRSMALLEDLAVHGDQVKVFSRDEGGRPPLASVLSVPHPDCVVYCCGPEPLLAAVESLCAGWPTGALHTERFAARAASPGRRDESFDVVCQRSGRILSVPPERSILEVAETAGLAPLSVCREGVCGMCETRVVAGTPEHRDSVLTVREKEAGESVMICVSRSSGAQLVLDL